MLQLSMSDLHTQLRKHWWALLPLLPLTLMLYEPVVQPAHPHELPLSLLGLVMFIVLFGSSVLDWSRGGTALWQLAGMVAISLAFAPFNGWVWLLFLTVVCLTPWAANGDLKGAIVLVVLIVGLLALESWLLQMPWRLVRSVAVYAVPDVVVSFMLRKRVQEAQTLARLEERDRIARDMHDVLGHTLSVIVLKSELAAKLVERNPERTALELQDIERISRAMLQQVRDTLSGYRSDDLPQEFANARATLETAGLHVTLQFENLPMPSRHRTALCLALREAVTNIVRHAKATTCHIVLSDSAKALQLCIEDNGLWQQAAGEGRGLSGMRERMAALGGTVELTHQHGTKLQLMIPHLASRQEATV